MNKGIDYWFQLLSIGPTVHDDASTWKHVPHHLPFCGGIHRSPRDEPVMRGFRVSFVVNLNKL